MCVKDEPFTLFTYGYFLYFVALTDNIDAGSEISDIVAYHHRAGA